MTRRAAPSAPSALIAVIRAPASDHSPEAVLERTIDSKNYADMRDRLREQIAVGELQLSEARLEQIDVEGVLAFAEHVI